ncbi:hypothetical protein [Nocardia farcinica]
MREHQPAQFGERRRALVARAAADALEQRLQVLMVAALHGEHAARTAQFRLGLIGQ